MSLKIGRKPHHPMLAGMSGSGGSGRKSGFPQRLSHGQVVATANQSFQNLLTNIRGYRPKADIKVLKKALEMTLEYHKNRYFPDNEHFVFHQLRLANFLALWQMDESIIAAGLVHNVPPYLIESRVDEKVAALVQRKMNMERFKYVKEAGKEQRLYCFKAMVLEEESLDVHLLAAADIFQTLLVSVTKEERFAKEEHAERALDLIAPFLKYLGYKNVSENLEKIAFFFLHPEKYNEYNEIFRANAPRMIDIKDISDLTMKKLEKQNIPAKLSIRPKSVVSIHKKLKKLKLEEIKDFVGSRYITDTVENCYQIEAIIKEIMKDHGWTEDKTRYEDFIKNKKLNKYQSIHLKFFKDGRYMEVQIRTEEMHKTAEFGEASHLLFKDPDLPVIPMADESALKRFKATRESIMKKGLHYIFDERGIIQELQGKPSS